MKKLIAGGAILAITGLTGCQPAATGQSVRIDAATQLVVSVEGVAAHPKARTSEPAEGEPMHRVLQGSDGKTLFAYDLEVSKSGSAGGYRFLLKPADSGPTFDAVREVTVNNRDDAVRVELMEEPGTGRKIEDVFHLSDPPPTIGGHLMELHNRFFRWVHGQ